MSADHRPEPLHMNPGYCRHCGRGINVMRERPFTPDEIAAAGRYGTVETYRHNPGRGHPHPRAQRRQ